MTTYKKLRKLVRNPRLFFSDFLRKRANQLIPGFRRTAKVNGKRRYSVIAAVYGVEKYLDEFFASLVEQSLDFERHIELIMVDDGSIDGSAAIVKKWQDKFPKNIRYIRQENGGQASARNTGIPYATGDWVTFIDSDDFVDRKYFEEVEKFLSLREASNLGMLSCNFIFYIEKGRKFADTHPLKFRFAKGNQILKGRQLGKHLQLSVNSAFFKQTLLQASGLQFDARIRPNFEDAHFVGQYLLRYPSLDVGFAQKAKYYYRKRENGTSTLDGSWEKPGLFDDVLGYGCVNLIERAVESEGKVPVWLQRTVLYHVSWYIKRIVSDTGALRHLDASALSKFRQLVQKIFDHIDPQVILDFELAGCWFFHKVGMLGLFKDSVPSFQIAYLDKYDSKRREVRLRYFSRYESSVEVFRLDGLDVIPVHAKTRVHKFMDETFVYERIVWLSIESTNYLTISINGRQARITLAGKQYPEGVALLWVPLLLNVQPLDDSAFPTRVRALRRLARRPSVMNRYKNAWLFMDRDTDADDNAEHLYRYVRQNHPEVNCYFLLRKSSTDWVRLKRDDFRLIEFGSLAHRLALLNATHLISSHADTYVVSFLQAKWYKDLLQYRVTFLQHGVTQNDLSQWLNTKELDNFVTSSPREYESIAGNLNRYKFTEKEVVLTGMPRHDALLNSSVVTEKIILIMPTWRLSLVGRTQGKGNDRNLNPGFYESKYALAWRSLLHSPRLREVSEKHGYRIVFFPHPNICPYLDWFSVPEYIQALRHRPEETIQSLFRRAAVMITDYSSVAFEMALLKKAILYYQFDHHEVFSGGHIIESGYFDCRKDGFGPVVCEEHDLLLELKGLLERNCQTDPTYIARMMETFAYRDGQNCRRTYEAIVGLDAKNEVTANHTHVLYERAIDAFKNEHWGLAHERWMKIIGSVDHGECPANLLIFASIKHRLGLFDQSKSILCGIGECVSHISLSKAKGQSISVVKAYRYLGILDAAKAALAEIRPICETLEIQFELAELAAGENNWGQAVSLWQDLIEKNRERTPASAWLKLAEAKHKLGFHGDQLTDLATFEKKAGKSVASRLLRAELNFEAGQLDPARNEALALIEDIELVSSFSDHLRLSKLLYQIAMYDAAESVLPTVEGAAKAPVILQRAEILHAKKAWQQLADLDVPEQYYLSKTARERFQYLRASALHRIGLFEDAFELLTNLHPSQPDCFEIAFLYAQVVYDRGNWKMASQLWRSLLEKHPDKNVEFMASRAAHALCMSGCEDEAAQLVYETVKAKILRDLRDRPGDAAINMRFLQFISMDREKASRGLIEGAVK